MLLTILSDSHDNIWALDQASNIISQSDVILHCGDLCSPFMIPRLVQAADGKPIHIVWGNNDGDKRLLMAQANKTSSVVIHGDIAILELGGIKLAMNHYPEIGRALAASGQFDLVCYGHDHTAFEERLGLTQLLNPGEIMGLFGRRTLAQFDTVQKIVRWFEL
jgi:uncharacterized protein